MREKGWRFLITANIATYISHTRAKDNGWTYHRSTYLPHLIEFVCRRPEQIGCQPYRISRHLIHLVALHMMMMMMMMLLCILWSHLITFLVHWLLIISSKSYNWWESPVVIYKLSPFFFFFFAFIPRNSNLTCARQGMGTPVRTLTMSFCWLVPTNILGLSGLIVVGRTYRDIQASVTPSLLGSHLSQSVSNRFPNLLPRWHQSLSLHERSKFRWISDFLRERRCCCT